MLRERDLTENPAPRADRYRSAAEAYDRLATLKHARGETARAAVAATLVWMGAERIFAAAAGELTAAGDRRLLATIARLEAAARELDAIPQRGKSADDRRAAWATVQRIATEARRQMATEHATRERSRH